MADGQQQVPSAPNNEWKDAQFNFDGKWIPDVDGALIGPSNYQTLENLRYKDSGLEGVNGYTKVNTTAITTYTNIRAGVQLRSTKTQTSYILVQAVNPANSQGRVMVNRTAPGSQGDFDTTSKFDTSGNSYFDDSSTGLIGRFSYAPQGNIAYANGEDLMIFGGDEQKLLSCFTVDTGGTGNPIDITQKANNTLSSTNHKWTTSAGGQPAVLVMTSRPIQALKIYVASANASAATMTVKTWTGSAFGADLVDTDGTDVGGKSLAQTGVVTLSSHTDGTSKPMHFEELYAYAYAIEIDAGSADLYHITVDFAFQSVKDLWDGVYRQPIQFQNYDSSATSTYDYTLQVNAPSDVNLPSGGVLDGFATSDTLTIIFTEQMAGIKFTMLGNLLNLVASTLAVKYWDGNSWEAVTNLVDGTAAAAGTPFGQSGLMSWTPPATEVPRTLYGSFGYAYQISISAGGPFTSGGDPSVLVDICTGVPHKKEVLPFDFTSVFGTRLMLGSYSKGGEGNRMDYSVANAPDAFNGNDSSDEGRQALYFGGVEPIVAATQVYNRFGSSVYAMLLVLKKNETYIVVGDTPDDFIIYDVAKTIGCVAPQTLATAEVGTDISAGQKESGGLTRNVAMWLSHSGPMMFDGAVLTPIAGVRSYFDPNDAKYIDFDLISQAKGWVDPLYKEYNLLIPSGAASKNNIWLVYDLIRRKWFTKSTGQGQFPQSGFEIIAPDDGERMVYGGIDTGFMVHMEKGTYWDDGNTVGITQKIKTGDFFPSQNIWDETLIRKFKIFIKKLTNTSSTNTLNVVYYTNTEINPGSGVIWQDTDASSGVFVSFEDTDGVEWASAVSATINLNLEVGLQRLIRVIQDLNRKGWAHAFEFSVTTNDVTKGFQPVAWGIRYRIERKDDTST